MLGSFICVVAMTIHSFGTFYEGTATAQYDSYRRLIIACARNNYNIIIKKIEKTESPRDTKKENPAPKNDQPGCVHSGPAAAETNPQRFKRLNGNRNVCTH